MKVRVDVDIYSMTVIIVTTFEEFKKLHKTADKDDLFCTSEYGQYFYVLVSDEWDSMNHYRFIQCMSHELNHAAMCLLNHAGVNFDYENQEALCYLQDFLMAGFFKAVEKHTTTQKS
jgi:Fe-S oxidoreductase